MVYLNASYTYFENGNKSSRIHTNKKKMYHWNDKWTLYVYLFGGLGMDQGEIILSWWEPKKTKSDKQVTSWDIRGPLRAVGIGD